MAVAEPGLSGVKDVMVFLGSAGIAVPLFHRLHINPVLGFMLAGVAVGPHGLGALIDRVPALAYVTITDAHRVVLFGEFGVVFLLFMIGLELSLPRLWSLRRYVFGLGLGQVALTAVIIGGWAGLNGQGAYAAALLGLALSFSSTAIVMQLLIAQHRSGTTEGQIAFAVLLCQDLMVVPTLFVAGVLGGDASDGVMLAFGWALLRGLIAVAVLIGIGHFTIRPLLRVAAGAGSHELFLAIVLLLILATAFTTEAAGLSMALGAFIAGLILADSEYRHQVEADIEPFKSLLLGVFFLSVGLNLDLAALWEHLGLVLTLAVLVLLAKAAIILGLALLLGTERGTAIETSFLLAHGGEFTLVVLILARDKALLDPDTAQIAVAATVLGMGSVPFVAKAGQRLSAWLEGLRFAGDVLTTQDLDGPIIIGGFGRVGRSVARVLDAEELPFIALETEPAILEEARRAGLPVFFGDASRADVLQRAGANRARAFVVTVDEPNVVERMVRAIRREWPNAPIFARAKDWRHAARLRRLGVSDVIPETVEGSLQLAGRVLQGLGLSEDAALDRVAKERENERARHQKDEE